MRIPRDVLLDAEEIHELTMYQGQGIFAATSKNGTPWISGRTKHKLFKIGLPERRCSTASFQHRKQGSNNMHLDQVATAFCSDKTLEKNGIS